MLHALWLRQQRSSHLSSRRAPCANAETSLCRYSPQGAPGMMPGAFGMVNPMALQMGLQTAGSGLLPPPGVALIASLA
jgi:hypothetical protein